MREARFRPGFIPKVCSRVHQVAHKKGTGRYLPNTFLCKSGNVGVMQNVSITCLRATNVCPPKPPHACLRWTTLLYLSAVAFCRSEIFRIGTLLSPFSKQYVLQNVLVNQTRKRGFQLHACPKYVLQNVIPNKVSKKGVNPRFAHKIRSAERNSE